jgi:hypothetical protein
MYKNALIINQSQQGMPEVGITQLISRELSNQVISDRLYDVGLVPLFDRSGKTDNQLLDSSIQRANVLYDSFIRDHSNNDIRQIDIHADAFNGSSFGCSTHYISARGSFTADCIYKSHHGKIMDNILTVNSKLYKIETMGVHPHVTLY